MNINHKPYAYQINSTRGTSDRELSVAFEARSDEVLYKCIWRDKNCDGVMNEGDLFSCTPLIQRKDEFHEISAKEIKKFERFITKTVTIWDAHLSDIFENSSTNLRCGLDRFAQPNMILEGGRKQWIEYDDAFRMYYLFPYPRFAVEMATVSPDSPDYQILISAFNNCIESRE